MKKKMVVISILVLAILTITQKSYAAIEIKPSSVASSAEVFKNTSVTNSYLLCLDMTKKGESLYGATVLPHLSTNGDWGAVSYLSNSIYGTNSAGQNTGVEVTINGVKYYSTNGNVTGVMNWGKNYYQNNLYTQTASIIEAYVADNTGSTAIEYVTEIEKAAKNNSRYVDILKGNTVQNTLGMAIAETSAYPWKQIGGYGNQINYPTMIREGLFGFYVGYILDYGYSYAPTSGAGSGYATFRPVIWNK